MELLNEYGWGNVEIAVNGRVVIGALGIKFTQEVESELVYGKGSKPLAINDSNEKNEGELTVHQSELEILLAATGNRGVSGLKGLTITTSYAKEGRITIRTLIGCRITSIGEEYKQNDKWTEIALPFIFLDIA